MRIWIVAATALSILAPMAAQAGASMTCEVDLRSEAGGRVQLGKVEPMSWVAWTPPSSGRAVEMGIGYVWSPDKPIGDTVGGHVTFTPATVADADDYSVRVTGGTGEVWTYGPADLDERPGQDEIVFVGEDVRGEAILVAMGRGERLKVEIIRKGRVEMTDTFDFSNIAARDALVAKAGRLAEAGDPSVCKPE